MSDLVRSSVSLASEQDLTANMADIGSVIVSGVQSSDWIYFMVTLDVNSSVNVQLQLVGGNNSGASAYVEATETIPGATINTSARQTYYELDVDEDQTICLPWKLNKGWDRVTLQGKAGTVGATAGDVTVTYKLG